MLVFLTIVLTSCILCRLVRSFTSKSDWVYRSSSRFLFCSLCVYSSTRCSSGLLRGSTPLRMQQITHKFSPKIKKETYSLGCFSLVSSHRLERYWRCNVFCTKMSFGAIKSPDCPKNGYVYPPLRYRCCDVSDGSGLSGTVCGKHLSILLIRVTAQLTGLRGFTD